MLRLRSPFFVVFALLVAGQSSEVTILNLRSPDGVPHQVRMSESVATAVIFVSAVCPMSMEYSERINQLAAEYSRRGVRIVLVNGNANESDAAVEAQRIEAHISLPIYRDNGTVAELLGATATPTAILIDRTGVTRYFGMIDNSRIPSRVTRQPLRSALDSVLAGRAVELPRTKVMGCAIKSGR